MFLFIVFIFFTTEIKSSDEQKYTEKNTKDHNLPFAEDEGYIPGGMPFNCTLKNEKGEQFSLADLNGNIIIILLFTTWCHNCPAVLRNFDSLIEKFKNQKNLKIIALNIGDESLNDLKIHYKANDIQLLDVYHSISPEIFRDIRGVPACFVLDRNGKPVWGYLGAVDYCSAEFIGFIEKLVK
ncbi:MAG: TlpA family protein disulfide reductase [Holosporaceae bacterium]|nr:TlpA family protein disulfide reductase [Holosporaceae bacterium]